MDTKKKLTKTAVDAIQAADKDVWVWDTELPGFGVRCTPTGRKTYLARYRTKEGTQRKQVIGRTCDMPPDKARELARKVFTQVAEGSDPMAQRRTAKPDSAKTVEAMFKGYVAHMKGKGQVSATEVERCLLIAANNAADALGRTRPAAAITADDVVGYIASIFQAGHRGAADKHRGYVSSAFGWAIRSANDYTVEHRQDWGIKHNPVADVAKDAGARNTRDRNLSASELHRLWIGTRPGAAHFSLETAAAIRVMIACGQRVQETLRLDGCEVDLEAKLWRMPAHKTKGGKDPHTIPLPDIILSDLELLKSIHGDGPLFPGRFGAGVMHHTSVMQALERWYEAEKVAPFQTRDLRRTWKSRAHDAGADRFTRDLIQQHSQNDTGTKHYDRAVYLPQMREAMAKWSQWLERVASPPAEVHSIAA